MSEIPSTTMTAASAESTTETVVDIPASSVDEFTRQSGFAEFAPGNPSSWNYYSAATEGAICCRQTPKRALGRKAIATCGEELSSTTTAARRERSSFMGAADSAADHRDWGFSGMGLAQLRVPRLA